MKKKTAAVSTLKRSFPVDKVPDSIKKGIEKYVKKCFDEYIQRQGLEQHLAKGNVKAGAAWKKQIARLTAEKPFWAAKEVRLDRSNLTPNEAYALGIDAGRGLAGDSIFEFWYENSAEYKKLVEKNKAA